MTKKARRRAAEIALIDAALRWRDTFPAYTATEALKAAVDQLRAVGLEEPDEGRTGRNHPNTSGDAHASLGQIGPKARAVLDEIMFANTVLGTVGYTCDQVEQRLNGAHQSISARVNELRDKGWILDSGARRLPRSGRRAIVWAPSTEALRCR